MTDVFDSLAELEINRSAFVNQEWLRLARLAARNQASVADVRGLLDLTGRSVAEFRSEVDHIKRITALRATVAATDRARAESQTSDRKFSLFREKRHQINRDLIVECNALVRAQQIAHAGVSACDEARRQLEAMGISPDELDDLID
ncbi:MAG: hypothetical protein ACKV2Q_19240 [Planctomycetaceae bacterium]